MGVHRCGGEGAEPGGPQVQLGADLAAEVDPVQPGEVPVEQRELELDLGVAGCDEREALGLGPRVGGVRHERRRLDLEQAGEQGHGPLAGDRDAALEVRQGRAGDGEAGSELLLGPAEVGPTLRDPPSEVLSHPDSVAFPTRRARQLGWQTAVCRRATLGP